MNWQLGFRSDEKLREASRPFFDSAEGYRNSSSTISGCLIGCPESNNDTGPAVLSPQGVCGDGSKSVWPLEPLQPMPEETITRAVRTRQSTISGKEEECHGSVVCGGDQDDPGSQEQGKLNELNYLSRNVSGGSTSSSQSASAEHDGGSGCLNVSGSHALGSLHGGPHAQSTDDQCPADGDHAKAACCPPDSRSDESRDDRSAGRRRDVGASRQWLSEGSAVRSLVSFMESLHEPPSACADRSLDSWFIAPLHVWPSWHFQEADFPIFSWTCEDSGLCLLVWYDPHLSGELVHSDVQDDWEFHVTKRTKKQLSTALTLLVGENHCGEFHFDPSGLSRGVVGPTAETSGLQERSRGKIGPAAETQGLQESSRGRSPTVETSGLQESSRGRGPTVETSGLQEASRGEAQTASYPSSYVSSNATSPPIGLPGLVSLVPLSAMDSFHAGSSQSGYKVRELFSPPRITRRAVELGLKVTDPPAFDKENGWDFFNAQHRAFFWKTVFEQKPDMILMSPECRPFSLLMNSNWQRMSEHDRKELQAQGLAMLQFCIQVAQHQLDHGLHFLIEQPSSWNTHSMQVLLLQAGVIRFLFDQCMTGLSLKPGTVSRKTTGIITNHAEIALSLSQFQCDKSHHHLQLQSGLPHKARIYPDKMIDVICQALITKSSFPALADDEEAEGWDLEDALVAEVDAGGAVSSSTVTEKPLTRQQKDKVNLLHTNLGHLPRDRMLSLLKAAGALPEVLDYVKKDFSCEQCLRQKRPVERRKAAVPITFAFNRILGIDYFFLNLNGKTHAFLNIVCQGTNYQQIGWLRDYLEGHGV